MKTIEAIKGYEDQVLASYGLPPITNNRHYSGECPLCGKRNKFRLARSGDRVRFICVCDNGDIFKLLTLTQGKEFKDVANEVDQLIGNKPILEKEKPKQTSKQQKVLNRWREIQPIKETQVEQYLKSRGICEMPKQGVKYSMGEWCGAEGVNYPCMYAIASDNQGNIAYTHKTFLLDGQKAPVSVQKKMETAMESLDACDKCGSKPSVSCAVKLFPLNDVLGISEGIESALSCKQIFNVNTWSVLNSSLMKKFRAPDGVKHLIIFADNDRNGTGLAAAFECASMNIKQVKTLQRVTVKWTELVDSDFNDMLNTPMQCYEWILNK